MPTIQASFHSLLGRCYSPKHEPDFWVIFDQWPKINLGLNVEAEILIQILKWYLL